MPAERLFSRALVRLAPEADGEDVAAFLQGLVTQDVAGELPVWAGLLTPQGKALFDFIVWPAGHGELLIDCEADAADELIKRLSLYRLRRKIRIERDESRPAPARFRSERAAQTTGRPRPRARGGRARSRPCRTPVP